MDHLSVSPTHGIGLHGYTANVCNKRDPSLYLNIFIAVQLTSSFPTTCSRLTLLRFKSPVSVLRTQSSPSFTVCLVSRVVRVSRGACFPPARSSLAV